MENGWGSFDVLKWKELLKKTAASLQCIIFLSKKCELMRIFWHPLFFISKTFVVFGDSDSEVFSFGSFCNAPKALAFRFPFRPWLKSTRKMTGGVCRKVPGPCCFVVFHPHLSKRIEGMRRVVDTPLKINMEHNHGGLEDHFPF